QGRARSYGGDRMSFRRRTFTASALVLSLIAAFAVLIPGQPAGAAGTAFVRVNQVGYPGSEPKRAFLMSSVDETGATFAVKNGPTSVFSAAIGADLGSWSPAFPHVYALDFTSVSGAGTYTIQVTGAA